MESSWCVCHAVTKGYHLGSEGDFKLFEHFDDGPIRQQQKVSKQGFLSVLVNLVNDTMFCYFTEVGVGTVLLDVGGENHFTSAVV